MFKHTQCLIVLYFTERDLAQCVEHPLEVRWVVGSIPLGGPIKLFLVPTGVTKAVVCAILSVYIKDPLLPIVKE